MAENLEVLELIDLCPGKWRHGFAGPTGLEITALLSVAQAIHLPIDEHLLAKLNAYEAAALVEIHKPKETTT